VLLVNERHQMRVVWNNAAWNAPLFGAPDPPVTATVVGGRAGSFEKTLFLPYPALPDGERVLFPAPPPPPPNFGLQIFTRLGVLALILGLVLFAMTRTITRPLAELAQAADAAGRGPPSRRLRERGPPEVRAAIRSYNAMQERLHRYLDSRTRVLAAMSHDLRTPLARLQLRVESIPQDTLRDSLAKDIEEMTHMVRGALSAFRGLNEEECAKWTDVNELVATVAANASDSRFEISIEGGADAFHYCRPIALKRCLVNLIDNALRHGERVIVRISDGEALTLSVEDDGPGIPDPLLEQVFEPFFRLESSRNRDSGGTGLGLCIARDIAQAHNGTLMLCNLASGGLAATLTLPREQVATVAYNLTTI
jgi:signal transduction histidine kinase